MHRSPFKDIAARAMGNMARMTVSGIEDNHLIQSITGGFMKGESKKGIERMQDYGRTSVPMKGNGKEMPEAIAMFMGGNRSHPVVMGVDDARYRPNNMGEGEVANYDHQGQQVYFHKDRTVIHSEKEIHVQRGEMHVIMKGDYMKVQRGDLSITWKGGKMFLGKPDLENPVMTQAGPSKKIFGVVTETDEAAKPSPTATRTDYSKKQGKDKGGGSK